MLCTQGVFHFERVKRHGIEKSQTGTVLAVAYIFKLLDLIWLDAVAIAIERCRSSHRRCS